MQFNHFNEKSGTTDTSYTTYNNKDNFMFFKAFLDKKEGKGKKIILFPLSFIYLEYFFLYKRSIVEIIDLLPWPRTIGRMIYIHVYHFKYCILSIDLLCSVLKFNIFSWKKTTTSIVLFSKSHLCYKTVYIAFT